MDHDVPRTNHRLFTPPQARINYSRGGGFLTWSRRPI
jgi:hypothetical protein